MAELSEYEAKRLRRVEENRQKLLTLNIPSIPRPATSSSVRKKREVVATFPVRRSLRIRNQESFQPNEELQEEEFIPADRTKKRIKAEPPQPLDLPVTRPSEEASRGKKQHVSSSQLEISLNTFHAKCLGTQLLPMGKQTVMQGLCPEGFVVKFSKMSGVQPWKNAVVLFVNVESDSHYNNVFQQEKLNGQSVVHFQWFGQGRWHDDTPMVQRLRQIQRGDERLRFDETYSEKLEKAGTEPLLLFIRHTQGPYIYCGRLGYLGYRPASKPLEFRWQLLDVGSLEWEKVQQLLDASTRSS